MSSDSELLAAWRAGDRAAGDALISRHASGLWRFFGNRAGGHAADLVQETLLACVRCRDRFHGQSSFRTYLFAIAKRILCRWVERQVQGARHPAALLEAEGGGHGASPSEEVDGEEPNTGDGTFVPWERWEVLEVVQRLNAEERAVIRLYYWEELSGSKLAQVLGVRESTARSRLRRTLARMRLELRPERERG